MKYRIGRGIVFYLAMNILLFTGGCTTIYNPATQRNETYFISESTEISIGKNMTQDIIRKEKVVNDSKFTTYVNEIGKKIVKVSDRTNLDYKFYILDNKEINAFALPGGYIFVNKGLIDETDENELAFVLGHEVGHVCARHSIKRLQASLGFNLVVAIALRNPDYEAIQQALSVVANVVTLGYSRSDEFLADSLGVKYMYKAGYKPEGAISLLTKLKKKDKGYPIVFLRSHPLPQTRIENIEKKIKVLKEANITP